MLAKTKHKVGMILPALMLMAIIAGLIINYLTYQYRVVIADERERLNVVVSNLDTYFNIRLTGMRLVAAYPGIKSLEPDQARHDLMAVAGVLGVTKLALYEREGRLVASLWNSATQAASPLADESSKEYFQMALSGKAVVSDRIVYGSLDNAYVSLHVPVQEGNTVKAVLTAYIPIHDISLMLPEQMLQDQYTFIVDSNAQLLYHPRLKELYPENAQSKNQLTYMLSSQSGMDKLSSMIDGKDTLFIYSDLNNTNWRAVTAIPLNSLYITMLSKSLVDVARFIVLAICVALLYGKAKQHRREREQLRIDRMACVNQLAAGIAHEIRNPLTSIKGFIQLMARRDDRPPCREHLEIIEAEIARIDSLISEFQMLARPSKEPAFEKVDICKLLEDVTFLMQSQLHQKKITLNLTLLVSDCSVFGDISQLKQVFINLLKNAVEAVPYEGVILVGVDKCQGMMSITVADNGNGIPQEIIGKLGTPFFTTKENGTGLGLSVCYSIVQGHGGKITVNSETGKGTTFSILLPAPAEGSVVTS